MREEERTWAERRREDARTKFCRKFVSKLCRGSVSPTSTKGSNMVAQHDLNDETRQETDRASVIERGGQNTRPERTDRKSSVPTLLTWRDWSLDEETCFSHV